MSSLIEKQTYTAFISEMISLQYTFADIPNDENYMESCKDAFLSVIRNTSWWCDCSKRINILYTILTYNEESFTNEGFSTLTDIFEYIHNSLISAMKDPDFFIDCLCDSEDSDNSDNSDD